MNTLYVMCGIPGSGKSTFARTLDACVILEADALREEIFGDANLQWENTALAKHGFHPVIMSEKEKKQAGNRIIYYWMDKRVIENSNKCNVVYDGTNLSSKQRRALVKKFHNYYDKVIAVFMTDSENLDLCLKRNAKRDRVVPTEVIIRMYKNMSHPSLDEGFDEIMEV